MCSDCNTTREAPGHALFCPTCIWCGARLIQRIQRLPRPASEIRDRCRQVLADWMAYGHAEQELRKLAKGPAPLAPTGPAEPLECAPPKKAKRR